MFGKKKPLMNEVFGELVYWGVQWVAKSKFPITLWNKTYHLRLCVVSGDEKAGVNSVQEEAYLQLKEQIATMQTAVEHAVSDYFDLQDAQTLTERFIPYDMEISTRGECAIIAENAADDDMQDVEPGLAVVVYPKLAIYDGEIYAGYVFGTGRL
jgi:hypothetical protein